MKKYLRRSCKIILLFTLCNFAVSAIKAQATVVDIGKSYTNITRSTGGTFNPGDILEIRVTFAVANIAPKQITQVQVFDTVPAKTTFITNSVRITTNEGITYQGPFTNAADADQGSCVGGNILINMGTGATGSSGGSIKNNDKPSFFNNTCIMVACYRVKINTTANYGDIINIGGKATYAISNIAQTNIFPVYKIILTPFDLLPCSNGTSISAAGDSLGTFASGTVQNRSSSLAFATTYIKQTLNTGNPQDYNYAIVNNSSADAATNPNSAMPESPSLHRVFGVWDIAGDHTGAANPALGNPPKAAGQRGGYMVLVNASYKTDIAYRETLSNLCPDTYYEFSAWFRNICPRCGCDSNGKGSSSAGYITGPGNDSSGVKPNISFEIDGLAYYTSGDIKYDRIAPWKKFGFTFKTGVGQTTASFLIRNNSPGGGGNDWALDDINVSHCGPTLTMNFNPLVLGCNYGPFVVTLSDTIRYLYSNSYVYYKWQRSNVGGTIWADLTGPGTSGVGMPSMVGGQYQYVTNLPPFLASVADSGRYYRVITGTSLTNLSNSCAYTDGNSTMIKVINCGIVLVTNSLQFKGQLAQQKATLSWSVSNEENLKYYDIEKSSDGNNFEKIGSLNAYNTPQAYYNFTDPTEISGNNYYRLKMMDITGNFKYSRIILLNSSNGFEIININNPIKNTIYADVSFPKEGKLNLLLFNDKGQVIKSMQLAVTKGVNNIIVDNIDAPNGIYFLSLEYNNETVKRKLVKLN